MISETDAKIDLCWEKYAGPKPISEAETLQLPRLIQSNHGENLKLYIEFHAYSQSLFFPYISHLHYVNVFKEIEYSLNEQLRSIDISEGNVL